MDGMTLPPEPVLCWPSACSRGRAGGKAAALAQLVPEFDVPPFFVLTVQAFDGAGLGAPAREALTDALARLGPGPFAVRSSGVEEDGATAAHAGQFLSLLNVAAAEVADAAERVWRSGFSDSLADYRRRHGLDATPQPPAVLVQRMAAARAAGVAFTRDPVTGADAVVINAVAGLGDRLVGGEVDGDVFRVSAQGVVAAELCGDAPVLTEAEARVVAELARRVEARFAAPQDIEWAFEGERLFLLQARPITTLVAARRDVDDVVTVWDNSNIVESYPGVVSPLTFSFAKRVYGHVYRAFVALLGVPQPVITRERAAFDTLLGRAHGRVYYNLLAWYRLLSLLPGFRANRAFMEQMMGVGEPLRPELTASILADRPTGSALADRLRVARVAIGLLWRAIILPRTIGAFYARLNTALARPDAAIDALSPAACAAEYRRLEAELLERWDAPLVNDFLCMVAFGGSRRLMERWAGADGLTLHGDVMIGQGDIVSAEPARRIRAMGSVARRLGLPPEAYAADPELGPMWTAYLARFGDRCTEELKLESATLHDDPAPLLAAVAAAARGDAEAPREPDPRAVRQRLRALFAGRPFKRRAAGAAMAYAKARVRDRENLRFERTRLFGRVRRLLRASARPLAAAGVLRSADDVFLPTIEEWLGLIEGGVLEGDLKPLVDARRAERDADLARPDPPERFETRGAFLPGLASLQDRDVAAPSGERRAGQGCCAGLVTARVRVVADPRTQALEPGEILVARHTDPGWIAVFANAAGVIAERGSLLSHSAIVAREMGVPCVVALKGATDWLATGDTVRLDGAAGTVERLERADPAA